MDERLIRAREALAGQGVWDGRWRNPLEIDVDVLKKTVENILEYLEARDEDKGETDG